MAACAAGIAINNIILIVACAPVGASVVIVPSMVLAQVQHVVNELQELLEKNGAEVLYAMHPAAGRMLGHMSVLLAEADLSSYDLLQ